MCFGQFYALLTVEDIDLTVNPHESDNWGLIGDYVTDYAVALNLPRIFVWVIVALEGCHCDFTDRFLAVLLALSVIVMLLYHFHACSGGIGYV